MGKLLSVITPCYNEKDNVEECFRAVAAVFADNLADYELEHIFCDNASTDGTSDILRRLAAHDRRVKVIFNSRNFGPFASLFNGLLSAKGDAVVVFLPADLQDPPEVIPEFVAEWETGTDIVYGVRAQREENVIMRGARRGYYWLVDHWSQIPIPRNAGEFQLIDRRVVEALRGFDDHYPFVRAMIAACGFDAKGIEYTWRARNRGDSKNTFYRLFDQGLNGLISTSNVPIRLMMLTGISIAALSLAAALINLLINLVFFREMAAPGIPTLIVALFFFSGVQLFFLGILGEYISSIHSQVRRRPLVIERERLNFDAPAAESTPELPVTRSDRGPHRAEARLRDPPSQE